MSDVNAPLKQVSVAAHGDPRDTVHDVHQMTDDYNDDVITIKFVNSIAP